MKDILVIAHFTQVPGETGNNRFAYIANLLSKSNYSVELITSDFSHKTKNHRTVNKQQLDQLNYKLTMLYETGYQKNVSLKRFYSHYIFGKSLKKYLANRKKPDLIYCAVPSLDVAKVAVDYAKKNNIKLIIDIQDLWPEAFKMVFNIPLISDLVFFPMKKKAEYIYSAADIIIGVSKTYVKKALKVNKRCEHAYSVYLGTDLTYFDKLAKENKFTEKPKDEIWIAYIGTLGHSYDLYTVIDAIKLLKDKGLKNIKFVVMGDGPLKSKFEAYAKEQEVYSEFTGRLEYQKMIGILKVCDIAVNPIKSGSAGSIINKVGDYAAAGLPVVNTQESNEYKKLLDEYNAGLNSVNNNPLDLSEKILFLIENEKIRIIMGENSRKLAEDKFDRKHTYSTIIKLLEE